MIAHAPLAALLSLVRSLPIWLSAAMLTAASPPASAADASGPLPDVLDLRDFVLTFSDDFGTFTSSPDGSRGWRTSLDWGNRTLPANHELQFYSDPSVGPDPFHVHDGILDIRATPGQNPLGLPYVSGAITTLGSFAQLFGYFEMRAKLPAGEGFWPAFWLLPADHAWPPELDILEQYGKDPHTVVVTTHSGLSGQHTFTYHNVQTSDVTTDYHTYGVDWESDQTRWYIDHRMVFSTATPKDMQKPMYIIANLAVSSPPHKPEETGVLSIDFIRAYRHR